MDEIGGTRISHETNKFRSGFYYLAKFRHTLSRKDENTDMNIV